MADNSNQTIIIKKIKKGGHGHHGGAWKVAYADFVTAMMAFFLLLWLLASTSEDTKKGIADYFTPTIGLKDAMGIGVEGGISPTKDGVSKSELMPPGVVVGQVQQGPIADSPKDTLVEGEADAKLFDKAQEALKQAMESDPNLRELTDNIVMEQTPEGLKLTIKDSDKHPMFLPASTELSLDGQKVLAAAVPLIRKMPNLISVTGHTDALPPGKSDTTNWDLSVNRANNARRFMQTRGLDEKQVGKVVGRSDREPLLPETPNAAQNRRIEIVLLKDSHMNQLPQQQAIPRPLMNAPRASDTLKKMQDNAERAANPAPIAPPVILDQGKGVPASSLPPVQDTIRLKPLMGATSSGAGNFVIPQAPSMIPDRRAAPLIP